MVGGYVCKHVTLRISKGLRAVTLAAGISRRVLCDTRVIFITIIAIYIALGEKIGTPLIRRLHHRTGLLRGWFIGSRSINNGSSAGFPFRVLIVTAKGIKSIDFA
jgi:hypothetical protein